MPYLRGLGLSGEALLAVIALKTALQIPRDLKMRCLDFFRVEGFRGLEFRGLVV